MFNDTRPLRRTFGPYVCVRALGLAGNNAVYHAMHQQTGRMVALRVMPIIKGKADDVLARCKEQLAMFKDLNVPNIVAIDDYGSDGDSIYLATRLMKGGSLEKRLARRLTQYVDHPEQGLPSLGEVAHLAQRLAVALDGLHASGIVHGQIDPGNIMFDEYGEGYIADVGMTRLLKIIYGLDTTNSFSMNRYSAPELWEGNRPLPASDQYSLACVIFELLTGRPPFNDGTIYDLMQQHMNDAALPPHYFRKGVPQAAALPFWQALAKPVERRHASVTDFADEFTEAIGGHTGEPTDFFTFALD